MKPITLTLLVCLVASAASSQEEDGLNQGELALFAQLPTQDGNTDGYPQVMKYNIDEHEPAKSIIKLGDRAIPKLMKLIEDDLRPTRAYWSGRSSHYTLTVADVAVCILKHIGGEKELAVLKRRQEWLDKVWHDMREYMHAQNSWSEKEKALYMELFKFHEVQSSMVITMWTVQTLEARTKKQ